MPTVTFTATEPDGTVHTRTSGSMPYVAAVIGVGVTWHKTVAAAHKAAVSRQHTWNNPAGGVVVPAVPTAINGKVSADYFAKGWGDIPADVLLALVKAKNGTA